MPNGLNVQAPEPVDTEGSAFTPPRTYSAREAPPAFTPPHGIPMVRLTKEAPWQDRMRTMLRMPVAERPAPSWCRSTTRTPGPPCRACST